MEYKDINDYEFLYLISDVRDDEAIYFLEKYEPFIQKKCKKWESIIAKLNIEMEDLKQEVRIAFLEAVKNFKEERNTVFYTYLNLVVDSRIKNLIRKMNNSKNLISSNCVSLSSVCSDRELGEFIPSEEDIEKKMEIQEIKDKVYEFLFKLPVSRALMMELYFNDYSIFDISKLLDEPEDSIRKSLRICRKKLKDYLQQFKLSML